MLDLETFNRLLCPEKISESNTKRMSGCTFCSAVTPAFRILVTIASSRVTLKRHACLVLIHHPVDPEIINLLDGHLVLEVLRYLLMKW